MPSLSLPLALCAGRALLADRSVQQQASGVRGRRGSKGGRGRGAQGGRKGGSSMQGRGPLPGPRARATPPSLADRTTAGRVWRRRHGPGGASRALRSRGPAGTFCWAAAAACAHAMPGQAPSTRSWPCDAISAFRRRQRRKGAAATKSQTRQGRRRGGKGGGEGGGLWVGTAL